MSTEQKTAAINARDLAILRAVFVTAFGAVVLWAGNRLVSTLAIEQASVSEREANARLAERRSNEIALMNQRIADIESYLRSENCRGVDR